MSWKLEQSWLCCRREGKYLLGTVLSAERRAGAISVQTCRSSSGRCFTIGDMIMIPLAESAGMVYQRRRYRCIMTTQDDAILEPNESKVDGNEYRLDWVSLNRCDQLTHCYLPTPFTPSTPPQCVPDKEWTDSTLHDHFPNLPRRDHYLPQSHFLHCCHHHRLFLRCLEYSRKIPANKELYRDTTLGPKQWLPPAMLSLKCSGNIPTRRRLRWPSS